MEQSGETIEGRYLFHPLIALHPIGKVDVLASSETSQATV